MDLRAKLRDVIIKKVYVSSDTERIASGTDLPIKWLFDFRAAILDPEVLDIYTSLFFNYFEKDTDIQVGGLEVAAIPLVAGIVQKSVALGAPVHGFFIRKSRKKYDRTRAIEGTLVPGKRIVLVDDILNSGGSIQKQIEILKAEGHIVSDVVCILRFRDLSQYTFLEEEGIRLHCLFELNDFSDALPLKNMAKEEAPSLRFPFRVFWKFSSPNPNHFYVVPKSAPAVDETRIYFGSDSGIFWCLNQTDGTVVWKYQVPFGALGKYIFSSPTIIAGAVIFGAYDGTVYALETATGKRRWTFWEADWVGSSPCVAEDLGLIYIGLEFGLLRAHGGLAALDAQTGEKRWSQKMPAFTHASPTYSKKYGLVVCGCNDGNLYGYDAKTGALRWTVKTEGDIKYGVAINDTLGLLSVGSFDGSVYICNLADGHVEGTFATEAGIYSTPLFDGNRLYVCSLDKNVYCFDVTTKKELWRTRLGGRIFSSPLLVDGQLYVGANSGVLYQLNIDTGEVLGVMQLSERIVNRPAYNPTTQTFFVPTDANEIYAARLLPPGTSHSG